MALVHLLAVALAASAATGFYRRCPAECVCQLDAAGNYENICVNGGWTSIPVDAFDADVEILVIRGPGNYLTIGPIFSSFKRLQTLRITDSNIPSVGTNSFWGNPSLRTLGSIRKFSIKLQSSKHSFSNFADLSRNNISALLANNFRGQEQLLELNLSHNRISGLTTWLFRNLTVSNRRTKESRRNFQLTNDFISELATSRSVR